MIVTGTHFNYYQLCHRKLWLFSKGINMEQESDLVYEGKLVHEYCYRRKKSRENAEVMSSISLLDSELCIGRRTIGNQAARVENQDEKRHR